jgi:hypothetical protein
MKAAALRCAQTVILQNEQFSGSYYRSAFLLKIDFLSFVESLIKGGLFTKSL